ncbi:MAG: hypothetical protein IJ418_02550 [Clostridia bacterium]|nr:hypothetical protein [Clostridia bacterium]
MAITKDEKQTLRELRRENNRLRVALDQEKEKVAFLGVLCDVDIDGLFKQEVDNNGEG